MSSKGKWKREAKPGVETIDAKARRLSQAILEACLTRMRDIDTVLEAGITEEDFAGPHRRIWVDLVAQRNMGLEEVDILSLYAQAKAAGEVQQAALQALLVGYPSGFDVCANLGWRAKQLRISVAEIRLSAAYQSCHAAQESRDEDAIVAANANLEACRQRLIEASHDVKSWAEELSDMVTELASTERPPVISAGIGSLDDHLGGGFGPGWLVIVMAGAKSGKTAYAVSNVALDALRSGKRALLISLEMSRGELIQRMLSAMSGVPVRGMRARDLTPTQHGMVTEAADELSRYRCEIRTGLSTMSAIAGAARASHKREALDLVVIDYLQLINNGNENRVLDIETSTRSAKLLAQELGCPVMLLSQPNNTDAKGNTIGLYSGKGSGSIAADADAVLVPMRGENGTAGMDLVGCRHAEPRRWDIGQMWFDGVRMRFGQGARFPHG